MENSGIIYKEEMKIFGESGNVYNFVIREDLDGANIKETVFLICEILINEGITNEVVKQQAHEITYLIKSVGHTKDFWKFLIDNKLIDSEVIISFLWDIVPKGKTLLDVKDDILKNRIKYPDIKEIITE
jgi:hypothetical protein